jgi:tetratricopeptide (TPR) repeat protein
LSPDNPGVLDTYAFVLYKNGQYQEAEKYIQSAVQLFEKSQTFASADVYEHLGLIKEKLNKNNEALGAYKTSLELYTKSKSEKDITRLKTYIEKVSSN